MVCAICAGATRTRSRAKISGCCTWANFQLPSAPVRPPGACSRAPAERVPPPSQESSDLPAPVPAQTSDPAPPAQASSGFAASPNPGTPTGSSASSLPGSPTFSGGVIIGVASTSPKKTIREFNQKSHYNEWLFFYDPTFDRGFEVQGPTPLTRAPAALQGPPNSSTAGTQPSAPQTPPAATQQ